MMPFELIRYFHDEDLEIKVWIFPDEGLCRTYLNNWHYDTIQLNTRLQTLPMFNNREVKA